MDVSLFKDFLAMLVSCAPGIENLEITIFEDDRDIPGPFPMTHFQALRLVTFKCHYPLQRSDIVNLAHVPHLRNMQIRINEDNESAADPDSTWPVLPFPALREAAILGNTLRKCTELLLSISDSRLEVLEMTSEEDGRPGEVQFALSTIQRECCPQTLICLCVDEGRDDFDSSDEEDERAPSPLRFQAFEVLFIFPNIQYMALRLRDGVRMDNMALARVADAWPRLETLCLSSRVGYRGGSPGVDLLGLITLAQKCPKLSNLSIPVNAVTGTLAGQILTNYPLSSLPRQNTLSWIDVGVSPIGDPAIVAKFLFALFPSLSEVLGETEDHEDIWKWPNVGRLLHSFSNASQALGPFWPAMRHDRDIPPGVERLLGEHIIGLRGVDWQ